MPDPDGPRLQPSVPKLRPHVDSGAPGPVEARSAELSEGQESQSDTEAERQRQLHIQWQGQPPGGSALLIQVLQEATETSRHLDIDQPALRAAISAAEAAGTDGIAACLHVPSWRRHSPPTLRPGARMAINRGNRP